MSEPIVAPSILAADQTDLGRAVASIEAGGADWVHVDVMDGHFVPNLTIGPSVVEALAARTSLPLDVHLMIEPVDPFIEAFARAGAAGLTVHAEACPHLDRTLGRIEELGLRAGVALNPATPVEAITWVLDRIDLVLVMTVNPGFGGQSFLPAMIDKVARAAAVAEGADSDIIIQVDGGITVDSAPLVVGAGATALVAGSAVFATPDHGANIAAIRAAARRWPAPT